ncbi:PAS domain-containing protein [Nocardioides pacificus]
MQNLTGVERRLAPHDLIVSKTDLRGHIAYVNDTFLDISDYDEPELLGKPHSILRHPEMPRAVFRLMWDTLGGGGEIFAYVVNRSQNGDHYWVMAHMTPSYDARGAVVGYHSFRRAPSRVAIERVTPLYRRLLAEEARHVNKREATDASYALLQSVLADSGQTYDELVWSLIALEGAA